jgi:Domain of unknown function (DUF4349)
MSQRDVLAELRSAQAAAPPELRARIRLIAAEAAPPKRSLRRRALLVLAPVALAAAAATAVVATRPAHHTPAAPAPFAARLAPQVQHGSAAIAVPAPSPKRVQRYAASLTLRVPTASAVSDGVKQALHLTALAGGHAASVHVAGGSARLVLEIPRAKVQQTVARLSKLGTIVGEQVSIQDAQAGIAATDRTIAQLQRQLKTLRAQPQTTAVARRIAALTGRVEALQRSRANTIRTDHFAAVHVSLATSPAAVPARHHDPLHGLAVAFRWLGIGLVYALALGGSVAALGLVLWLGARLLRRRRVDALLNRP